MKKWEPLRGYGMISHVYDRGRRLDAEMVRCIYIVTRGTPPGARVAFSAPAKLFNAVRRNRLKRLMREAFAKEWQSLLKNLESSGVLASLLFIFTGKRGTRSTHYTLQTIHKSIASLCTTLRTQL